jgi:hypothetical protein
MGIVKKTVPTGVATKISNGQRANGRVVYHYASGVSFYAAFNGDSGVTDATGAKPGIKIESGVPFSEGNAVHRDGWVSDLFVIQNSGSDQNIMIQVL